MIAEDPIVIILFCCSGAATGARRTVYGCVFYFVCLCGEIG